MKKQLIAQVASLISFGVLFSGVIVYVCATEGMKM